MFIDTPVPVTIRAYPFTSSPRWSTNITMVDNGSEHRNQNWQHPLHRFVAPEAIRCQEDLEDVKDMWMALAGPADSFPFRDPLDFASRRLTIANEIPVVGRTDQLLGVGDGLTREFQLQKAYTFGTKTYERLIYLPVVETIVVGMNALPPDTADPTLPGGPYTVEVERRGGIVRFTPAPEEDMVLTWGGLFDVECRFEQDDSFDGIVRAFGVTGFADLTFVEIRPC